VALKDLEITPGLWNRPGQVLDFCSSLETPLEKVAGPTLRDIGLEGIVQHSSQSLRELSVHHLYSNWQTDTVNAASLRQIQEHCTLITDLHLIVARAFNNDWPYEIFDIRAACRNLRRLELWFERGRLLQPGLTVEVARETFSTCATTPHAKKALSCSVSYSTPAKLGRTARY
jgi:hypothetical protein